MEQTIESSSGSSGWFFNHLPAILWQRRLWIIGATLLLFLAGLAAAYLLPTMYRSSATLLVQSQDLPTSIVDAPSSGVIEQRIAKIRERVLSRGDLVALIEQNDLYASERRKDPLSKVIEKMRQATTVGALAGDIGQASGGQSNTIAINMSFDYPDPVKAQAVLQSYVASFLRMDNEAVEQQAGLTVRFLQDQATKLQGQVGTIEGQITELKARNGSALAGSGGPAFIDTGTYSAQIAGLESQNRQLLAGAGRTPRNPEIAAAESALAAAKAKYADSHPDVLQAQQRLEQARAIARSEPGQDDAALVRAQVEANNRAIGQLSSSRQDALSRAAASSAGSARAPAILEQAMQLENRAGTLRDQYKDVSANLLKAQNSERMANEQRAERLSLVDAPDLPDHPHSPNRPLLIVGGLAAGLMLGLFLALGLELLNQPLRSPSQVEAMGLPVLGVVPVLTTVKKERRRFGWGFRRKESFA
ncbi:MAG: Wzz/FepE/Etk N-terminal domain-containing protein [Sphingomicrobium sp.]